MAEQARARERVFKTAWFSKAARKALIPDKELCVAIAQVMLGQADDLGGGVFKKRLGKNHYRSILLAKGHHFWVYAYLFAKKDRANISNTQLDDLRELAALYARKTDDELSLELREGGIVEICDDEEAKVQKRTL